MPSPRARSIRSRKKADRIKPSTAATVRLPSSSTSAAALASEVVIDNSSPLVLLVEMPVPVRMRRTASERSRCASAREPLARTQAPVRQLAVRVMKTAKMPTTDNARAVGSEGRTAASTAIPMATGTSTSQVW